MSDIETLREFIGNEGGPYVGERKEALAALERVAAEIQQLQMTVAFLSDKMNLALCDVLHNSAHAAALEKQIAETTKEANLDGRIQS